MIKFNELRITADNKYLIIDTSVLDIKDYFKDVYISRITVVTHDKYSDLTDSKEPVFDTETFEDENNIKIYKEELAKGTTKQIRIVLDELDLQNTSMSSTMFFVYVYTTGAAADCIPCSYQCKYDLGVTFSMCKFYNRIMPHIREIDEKCVSPRGLINEYLKLIAVKAAVETGNYIQAIQYYKEILEGIPDTYIRQSCNCR